MAEPFFSEYAVFSQTSKTGSSFPRLQARYEALIENNLKHIRDAKILDLGSHDGRWAFAGLKQGAAQVVGVEPRALFVKKARATFQLHNLDTCQYKFIQTTAQKYLTTCPEQSFDTIFCFGLLYHLPCFEEVLTRCQKITRRSLLLDTVVYPSQRKMIWEGQENMRHPSNGISDTLGRKMNSSYHQIRIPSLPVLTELLSDLGFRMTFYPWHSIKRESWDDLDDYFLRQRVTISAELAS
ncbi:MAG: class I SAM-dependent methyltransferase [Bdellovibrionales bacterium]|nr:class I SAM-dependent methyltransferase [Bdellovibrionales bacterium]